MTVRLVAPCLVVLVGPSGSGKSWWAAHTFRDTQVVSSDRLRALVGEGEHDQRAGTDAFAVLDEIVARRLKRKLLTVVDTLGLDPVLRERCRALARKHGLPCYAVAFDTPERECRSRNRSRDHEVPSKVMTQQFRAWADARETLPSEGFDGVHGPGPVRLVPPVFASAGEAATRQKEHPVALRFGLQLPRFAFDGGAQVLPDKLAEIATAAEEAGFSSLWLMDHFLQIPQVGREWEDIPESWTTLGFLAAQTRKATLGTLVTGVTYRNVAHVAKLAATLDVLSGGRAVCGIGAAWFEREHRAYGWDFPPLRDRYALLEDALELLPLMWGPGAPPFKGRVVNVAEAVCYPRPVQERIPVLVGGSGERTTLRLAAKYADACNLFGDAATVSRKVGVLRAHCADAGRDPSEVEVTHLATMLVGEDDVQLDRLLDRMTPAGTNRHAYAASVNAATVDDQVGRFRELAEAGVQTAIVSLPDLAGADEVRRARPIVDAFAAR